MISDVESDIYNFVSGIMKNAKRNDNILIGDMLSIVIHENKYAIDVCSARHKTEKRIDKFTHKKKLDKCTSMGYRLLTVYDDEWIDKKEICKSRIKHCFGITNNKIGARVCAISEITNSEAMKFCEKNHIQGRGQSHYALALYKNGDIISVMTFSKPSVSKNSSNYEWELNRFCSLLDYSIPGAANRLLSFFKSKNKGKKMVTFSDLRWGNGNVYEKMGFTYQYVTDPNYYYSGEITNWKRKHRFNFTKGKLVRLFGEKCKTSTEFEITDNNGINRIWDCGHMKFSMIM